MANTDDAALILSAEGVSVEIGLDMATAPLEAKDGIAAGLGVPQGIN